MPPPIAMHRRAVGVVELHPLMLLEVAAHGGAVAVGLVDVGVVGRRSIGRRNQVRPRRSGAVRPPRRPARGTGACRSPARGRRRCPARARRRASTRLRGRNAAAADRLAGPASEPRSAAARFPVSVASEPCRAGRAPMRRTYSFAEQREGRVRRAARRRAGRDRRTRSSARRRRWSSACRRRCRPRSCPRGSRCRPARRTATPGRAGEGPVASRCAPPSRESPQPLPTVPYQISPRGPKAKACTKSHGDAGAGGVVPDPLPGLAPRPAAGRSPARRSRPRARRPDRGPTVSTCTPQPVESGSGGSAWAAAPTGAARSDAGRGEPRAAAERHAPADHVMRSGCGAVSAALRPASARAGATRP